MDYDRSGVALSRRGFVRLAGSGLVVGTLALLEACAPSAPAPTPPTSAPPTSPPAAKPTTPPAPTAAPAAPKPTAAAAVATPTVATAAKPQPGLVPGQIAISKSVSLPTRIPLPGAKPDLPGSADGLVDPGYINYPATPIKAVA